MNLTKIKLSGLILIVLGISATVFAQYSGTIKHFIESIVYEENDLTPTPETLEKVVFYDNFDDASTWNNWFVNDADDNDETWGRNRSGGYKGTGCANCEIYQEDGDDWLFSPQLSLTKDRSYRLSFWSDVVYYTHHVKVYLSKGTEADSEKIELLDLPAISDITITEKEFTIPEDGDYYLAFYCVSKSGSKRSHLRIDEVKLIELEMLNSPKEVDELKVIPGEGGAQTMSLSWKNPISTYGENSLTSLTAIHIYKDGAELPIVYTDNLEIGAIASWNDPTVTSGHHIYMVRAVNEFGEGLPSTVQGFVGTDYPSAPTFIQVEMKGKTPVITWGDPADNGVKGG